MTAISGLNLTMNTNPTINARFEYEYKKKGGKYYYRLAVIVDELAEGVYFPYNLKVDITANNTRIVTGGKIKDASPITWKNAITAYFPSQTKWYDFGSTADTCRIDARIYSTQTSGSGTGNGTIAFADTSSSELRIKLNGSWVKSKKVYVKTDNVWRECKKLYIKTNNVWKEVSS